MSNPLSNPHTSLWMERMIARSRDALRRINFVVGGAKSSRGWMIGLAVCALLVGGISLAALGRDGSTKTEAATAVSANTATKMNTVPVKAERSAEASAAGKEKTAAEKKSEASEGTAEAKEAGEPGAPNPKPQSLQNSTGAAPNEPEQERESPDLVRLRAQWFHDQRAYPNKHVPAGALQKAIQQRDLMRQQQRNASKTSAGAQGIISFPGNALWHLMGPQPVNVPFVGTNGGFPTVSGRVTAIAVDPTNANIVYVGGAAGGVWKTTDGGTTWTSLTDSQPSLAVGSITIDPNSCTPAPCKTIYVGTGEENFNIDAFFGAGVLKSIDGGTTWTQLGTGNFVGPFSTQIGAARVGAVAVDPNNSSVILAGVAFADRGSPSGIYRSTDSGTSWGLVATASGDAGTAVVFDPVASTKTAYAALGFPAGDTNNGIYKSIDEGATWTKLTVSTLTGTGMGRITLGFASSTTVYAAIADPATGSSDLLGLFKTTDGGTTWNKVTSAPAFCNHQCFYDMAIGVDPANANVVVLGGGAGPNNFTSLFESTNGGTSWTPASKAAGDFSNGSTTTHPHVDTHAIVFSANGATLYVGNDGGIWSTNTPAPAAGVSPTWTDLNAGLAITQFYPGPTAAVSDENYGFGGTQDNDTELFSGSLQWTNEFACGDGGFTAIDQKTPTTIYTGCDSLAGSKIKKAVMNGQFPPSSVGTLPAFDVAETAITNSGDAMQFIPPIALDESNPENLYFGTCRVWMTNNAASSLANTFIPLTPTWTAISGDLSAGNAATTSCPSPTGAGNITTLDIAHSNSSVIVAGTSNGKVWETTSGGALWTEIDAAPLPARHVTAVRTKRSDSTGAIVYVTLSGFDCGGGCGAVGHVFKTTTAGTTNTWTNITGDLPDIPVNDIIVFHQGNPTTIDALYIATDVGVFACPDPEAATPCTNWTVIGDGLPNSPVLGLAMRRTSRILRAATHGRSMWQIQLTGAQLPTTLAALSAFTPAAVNVVPGGAGTTAVTVTGLNFSANTQVQFARTTTGVTTAFVNTTQLNVTLSNTLLQVGGVFPITLTDPAGVDPNSSLLTGGGGPFAVMNPLLDPLTMTPATALTYTAVPFQFTATSATEPFLPNTVLAFYDMSTPPVLQFQLPTIFDPPPTVSSGGTVYKLTTAITDFTTPFTYKVVPFNPAPGGAIDPVALNAPAFGLTGPVPFTFTVTANPGPVIQVSSPLSLLVNAVGANTGTTYNFFQVSNLVGATLNITNATITGTNPANFAFIAPGAAPSCNFDTTHIVSLTGGSSCFFGLKYTAGTPPGNAQSVATLNITDNITGGTQSFPITGNISPTAGLVFLLPVNFGSVTVGTTSPTMNATLSNFSGSSISVTSTFSIAGANQGDFHIVSFVSNGDGNSACPSSIPFPLPAAPAPGSSCDVTLTFTPSLPASAESANLNVTASVPVTTLTPNLTGTGIEITSISPSIVATGGPAFTLTVNGGGFAPSAVVNVSSINGTNILPRLTTFVSANQLLASIPASDIATAGSLAITVTTPVPGGTTSEPKTLVVAQAPVATNDNINFALNATTTPARITQDTTQATANTGGFTDPKSPLLTCAPGSATLSGTAKSVWFQYKPTLSGRVIADTRFSSYPTIVSVWTTNAPTFTTFAQVACNSGNVPTTPAESLAGFAVTAGTTYYVMVTDATSATPPATAPGGTLTASLDFASTAPANDDNATPTVIAPASVPYSNTVNTIQATANTNGHLDPTLPAGCATGAVGGGQGNTVWYSFTPASSGTVTADTLTSPYETVLNVTSGTPTGPQVACNASAIPNSIAQSQVSFAATASTTYFFMVSSFLGDGGTTNFHLTFSGAAIPSISFAPTNVPFGNQQVGIASPVTNVTVTNNDVNGAALHITGTSIAGGSSLDFTLVAATIAGTPCPIGVSALTLAQGASCVIGIKFKPTASGARNSNFNVTDDAAASPQSVPLTGTGTLPSISFNPTPLNFGNQQVGITSTTMNVTVTNNTVNGDPLHITGTSIAGGANTLDFTLVAPTIAGTACPIGAGALTLAQGASCVIGITFKASVNGAENSNFSVTDDAAASPQSVPLNGTGTQPGISFSPTPVNFGNVTQGVTSPVMNVTVTNNAINGDPLHMTGTSIAGGANTLDFSLVAATIAGTPCPIGVSALTLAQGASCVIGITFKPSTVGAENSNFDVTDDAAASPQSVPLNGTGVSPSAPIVTFSAANIPFGNQKVGTTSGVMNAMLTNTGNANLNITAVSITGANAADFTSSGTTCTGTTVLTPTQACTLGATFSPGAQGARTAAFTITDNASGSPHSLPLSGTGTLPGVVLAPTNIPFGNLPISTTSATTNVTLTNSGQASLNITGITLTGTDTAQFTLGAPTSGTACPLGASNLAAGANCAVGVKFAPTTTGAKSASVSFVDDASGSPQTVPLTGTGTAPGITFAPTNIPFGSQRTGTSTAITNVTITNSGTATLNITSITLTGANPTQFTLGAPTSGTACVLGVNALTAGNSCNVGVKFSPTNTGAQSANMSVADDAAGSPQTVPLTGTGTVPVASLAPANIPFGNQNTGTSSATTDVTLTNTGLASMSVTSITLTGTDTTQFTLGAPMTGTACPLGAGNLAAGANCRVGVKFAPTTTGAKSASVSFADDATGSPQTVPLTGTGITGTIAFSPSPVNFGNQHTGTTSGATTVTVTNSGGAAVHLAATAVSFGGTNPGDFAAAAGTTCTNNLTLNPSPGPGNTCVVNVTFTPGANGPRAGTLLLADDATGSPQSANLTGTGTAPAVTFAPTNVPFGNQKVGTTSATTDVMITNSGTATLNITSITLTGTDPTQFTLGAPTSGTACSFGASALNAGANCKVGVQFAPTTIGAKGANVSFADDAAASPQTVPLTGTGAVPAVTLAPANVPFGNQKLGTNSATTDVTITNSGLAQLNITSITLTGADAGQYTIGAPTSGTACPLGASNLAAGANCKVGVAFAPTSTGLKNANVSVADDAAASPQTVPLTGTGTVPAVTFAPVNVPFGNQRVGTTSAKTDVTITNSGLAQLNINSIGLIGTDTSQFALGAPTSGTPCPLLGPSNLAAGANCKVGVTFAPTTSGAKTASLSFTDDAVASPQTVPLTGTGTVPATGLVPTNVAFGNQTVSTSSLTTDVTLTNTGLAQLNLTSITLTGTDPTQFTLGAPTSGTACPLGASNLAAGANCKVGVKFSPTTTGAKSASLSFADDATGSPQTVPLTGTGVTATVTLNPPLAFGNQRRGTSSAAMTVTFTNTGSVAVHLAPLNSITFTGANAADFSRAAPSSGTPCADGATVAASGGACTIGVVFTPATAGAEAATLNVADDAPGSPQTDNLTGTGIFPQATPAPSPVNFNNQVINTTSGAMTLTLTNGGTDVLHLAGANAVVIGGTNPGDFATAAGTTCTNSATVNPAANCVINLTFTPSALNARTATLTITDDASPTTQVVTLNGTGTNPAPTITSPLVPASTTAGGAAFLLTINGTNFVAGATVNFGANPALTPTTITAGQILVTVPAADIAIAATVNVTVTNPAPGGGTSAAATFTINNPLPTLLSILPTSGVLGQSVNMTLTGTNFVAGSIVNFGANADSGAVVSNGGATLTITIPAAQVNAAGPVSVTVKNPAPGGGTTAAQTFTVNNPVPTLTSIAPTSGLLGQSVNMTLTGTNFVAGSIVNFGANANSGGVVSNGGNTLTITIPAAQVNVAGPVSVTVKNPAPGGGTTAAQTFTVNNPAPTLTSVAPTSGVLGQAANLTLTGTNFIAGSIVNFGANADVGGVVSNGGNTLTITIPAAQLNAAGPVNITVKNPAPGGGTSAAVVFTVNNPQPVATKLSPTSVAAGVAAFPLTITGSNFVAGAKVDFGADKGLTPTSVTAVQITVTIPAADVATGGTPQVIVNNPTPTVGPSAGLTFTINNPMPTLTNVTSGGKTHAPGGAPVILTVTGTNFVSTSAVNFNGKAEPTTFVSATSLTGTIPASDVSTAGMFPVTVTNPSPGGGTTTTVDLFVIDGYTVAGPANTPVKAGQQAVLTITLTPTANGFTNPVSFTLAGLPAHTTATFSPTSVTPNGAAATTTLTIMTTARGAAPPSAPVDTPVSPLMRLLPVLWLAAMLVGLAAMQLMRRTPKRRRYATVVSLLLVLVTGAVLAGCSGGRAGTPAGAAQLTITATSGSMVQATPANSVMLTVQ
jgi:IPT/TIG domain-containing protein